MWGSKMPRQPCETCSLYKGGSEADKSAAQAMDEHGSLPVTLPCLLQRLQNIISMAHARLFEKPSSFNHLAQLIFQESSKTLLIISFMIIFIDGCTLIKALQ